MHLNIKLTYKIMLTTKPESQIPQPAPVCKNQTSVTTYKQQTEKICMLS